MSESTIRELYEAKKKQYQSELVEYKVYKSQLASAIEEFMKSLQDVHNAVAVLDASDNRLLANELNARLLELESKDLTIELLDLYADVLNEIHQVLDRRAREILNG